ncbi:hypothetical protein B0H13DRAFT_1637610 [Mycena leptocephala]|nr:hypothetical protein B0H13DRAFT_1637610 [Mycena leptocephala]
MDGQLTIFNPPDTEKYFWAFDPAGLDWLTNEEAADIGLPAVEFSLDLWRGRLAERDYDLIRDFHIAKGFDPYSQDAAITMGYPLIDIGKMKKFIGGVSFRSSNVATHSLIAVPVRE